MRSQLILRLRLEVVGVVALVQLARGLAREAVDHAPAFHGWPLREITPIAGPEAQENPSGPVISESYHGLGYDLSPRG